MAQSVQHANNNHHLPIQTVYVAPLKANMHVQLRNYFGEFGQIDSVRIGRRHDAFYGYYVQFKTAHRAQVALSLKSHRIGLQTVIVRPADSLHQHYPVGTKSKVVVAAEIAAQRNVQTGDMFKMNIDCFEESFDYLSFYDLSRIGGTCKYLSHVAGHCFYQSYPYAEIKVGSNLPPQYIRSIHLLYDTEFQQLVNIQSQFHRLKELHIQGHPYHPRNSLVAHVNC